MESLAWVRAKYSSFLSYIERHNKMIPLSGLILNYLRIPLAVRLITTFLILLISNGVIFIIGFIVLQSKARNEVLSLVTAFQNNIDFPERLYFYYAFIYLFITVVSILLFGLSLFYGRILIGKSKWMGITVSIFLVTLSIYIIYIFTPLIPYYLIYASKNSSFWELSLNYFIKSEDFVWIDPHFNIEVFQEEVFISLQSGNMLAVFLVFSYLTYRRYYKNRIVKEKDMMLLAKAERDIVMYSKDKLNILKTNLVLMHLISKGNISKLTNSIVLFIFVFSGLMLSVTHTVYQLGSFGKNLAQFDTDFVLVNYSIQGQDVTVEGIRIYQDKNYIVLRDSQNIIHNIYSDQIHVKTMK